MDTAYINKLWYEFLDHPTTSRLKCVIDELLDVYAEIKAEEQEK